MSVRPPRARSLWPREHGAYIQLLVPLVMSLLATRLCWATTLIAIGAGFAFLASEPLRVVLGGRGPRLREVAGARARRRLAVFATLALLTGGTGLALAPATASWLALALAPLVVLVIVAARSGNVQTVLGECAAAIALAGAGAPVAVAGDMKLHDAIVIWFAWSLAYAMTVIVVHRVIAHHRRANAPDVRPGLAFVLCAIFVVLIKAFPLASFATPIAIAAVIVLIWQPRATRLRAIGIAFLASSAVAAFCAITTVRQSVRDRELEDSFRAAMAAHHAR